VRATLCGEEQGSDLGQVVVVNGSDTIAVVVNRVTVQRTHIPNRPNTTTIRNGRLRTPTRRSFAALQPPHGDARLWWVVVRRTLSASRTA
jgi:hypothetical protein